MFALLAALMALLVATGASAQAPQPAAAPFQGVSVASYARLDPAPFERRARIPPAATPRDLRDAALRAVDPPLSRSLRVVIAGEPEAATAPRTITVVAEGLADDAVASVLTELVFDRADGRWVVAQVRRAVLCRRGAVTDRFIAGPCP